ncbi:MAG: MBL fold metallo-hydrolase [Aristaeellaceae bacterium]
MKDMQGFRPAEVMPGVIHIEDPMGVCMTLLQGRDRALLVDAGYGTADVGAFIAGITDRPVTLVLTHGHHDHALGARWFPASRMFAEDQPDFALYTGEATRARIAGDARARGISLPEDFLTCPIPMPGPLAEGDVDLGGLTARILRCPGHTPGSAVVYVPERELLLTGDDWNPCTWLFFPAALPVEDYRRNVSELLTLPFRHVLCSHRHCLYGRDMLEDFLLGLTDDALLASHPVDVGYPQRTWQAELPRGQVLVFDRDKFDGGGAD